MRAWVSAIRTAAATAFHQSSGCCSDQSGFGVDRVRGVAALPMTSPLVFISRAFALVVEMSIPRKRSLVIGHWSLVTSHLSLVTCHWSLVTGHWSFCHWSLVVCHWSLVHELSPP